MAKQTASTPRVPEGKKPIYSHINPVLLGIVEIVSRFGIPGTFIILLLWHAKESQYQDFIDKYILLKNSENTPYIPYFTITLLILVGGIAIYLLKRRIKLKNEQISQLQSDLRALQEATAKRRTRTQ